MVWGAHGVCAGGRYVACNGNGSDVYNYEKAHVFPLKEIELEGELFPAPAQVESLLKSTYGSVNIGAKYNPETKKYEDPE